MQTEPHYAGYDLLRLELAGQTETATELRQLAKSLPDPEPPSPVVVEPARIRNGSHRRAFCACGTSRPVPTLPNSYQHVEAVRCFSCASRLAWDQDRGWVTAGLLPANITCDCGHRFGVRPDQGRTKCHQCGQAYVYGALGWHPLERTTVTIGDAHPLNDNSPICILA